MSLEALKRKIKTTSDLLSVVKTMKSLASVNIRQYEHAVTSLQQYARTVDLAWMALFRTGAGMPKAHRHGPAVLLTIGSDQGMVGQFNDLLLEQLESAEAQLRDGGEVTHWTSGERVLAGVLDSGRKSALHLELPSGLPGVDTTVLQLIGAIENWQHENKTGRIYLLRNRPAKAGSYETKLTKLVPLDEEWAERFHGETWPRNTIPLIPMNDARFFSHLFGQYLYITLYRVLCQSLASENAARLAAMQAAEKNIGELQDDLMAEFRQTRQTLITSELLDVVSGFEAMSGTK